MNAVFEAYVEPARRGAGGWWRLVAGLAILFVALFFGTVIGLALAYLLGRWPLQAPELLFAALFGLVALIPALWLVVERVHRRRFRRVLGVGGRLRLRGLLEGALLMLALTALSVGLSWLLGWIELTRTSPPEAGGFLVLGLFLLIPLQSAAEELVFRGYLIQEFAARTRIVVVWLLAPAALFTALHISADQSALENLRFMAHIAVFALFASWLVWLTGGLSHAIGVHAANNLVALLIYEAEFGLDGLGFLAVSTRPGAELALLLLDIITSLLGLLLAARLFRPERADGDAA